MSELSRRYTPPLSYRDIPPPPHPDADLLALCGRLAEMQEKWQRLWDPTSEDWKLDQPPTTDADHAWQHFNDYVWPGIYICGQTPRHPDDLGGRLLVQYDAGVIHLHNAQIDGDLVIAATDSEPAIGAVAALIRTLKFKPVRTAPFGFALVLAQRAASMDQAATFAHLVDNGKAEEEDATRRLHVRLRDAGMAKERISQLDVAILTVWAWNAWIGGRPVQLLKVTDADRAAGGFPRVSGGN